MRCPMGVRKARTVSEDRGDWGATKQRQRQPAARTDVSEEVKYYSKENQRARRRPFLKFFMLNQFKLHPMLGVRQRSRLVTEE